MAEYSITLEELMELMGFETLNESIQLEIYQEITVLLEGELDRKRNNRFGLDGFIYVDIEGDHPIDTFCVVIYNGKLVEIELNGFDGIFLSGHWRACQGLKRKFLTFARKLPKEKILDKIAPKLEEDDQATLRKWRNCPG
ncbi:MAG TPA: hypothetical protein P5080_03945 [Candidatus Paceibacterota bacterium]|nr:hypothetical protein [Candidatus Pacearchaeota archaeon]HRZ51167.1 hypothetical protein [Candidatus Paceibacterota bacterium]HSA36826.1 hypothetical protein [Candidatus Paceibacterota bacterium]